MKLNNPFDRLKKTDFVPMSLFPASKFTRTSMQIGRAVPVYCAELMKNNTIQVSASQLTRFATMVGPVMSNFEVNLNYYFVPYVALDHFFDDLNYAPSTPIDSIKLNARKFFNPATPDEERVHPIPVGFDRMPFSFRPNCSLLDHLGYIGNTDAVPDNQKFFKRGTSTTFINWSNSADIVDITGSGNLSNSVLSIFYNEDFAGYAWDLPIFAAQYISDFSANTHAVAEYFKKYPHPFDSASIPAPHLINTAQRASVVSFLRDWSGEAYEQAGSTRPSGLAPRGNSYPFTYSELLDKYNDYLSSVVVHKAYKNLRFSSLRWLVYQRIYADYYLDQHFTPREDYLKLIGNAYTYLADAIWTDDPDVNAADAFDYSEGSGYTDFFIPYLSSFECMPVLWEKDSTMAVVGNDHLVSTPIGSTVEQNFYNRMYARFKDMVARLGMDYKANTDALYGGNLDDNTLHRAQLVGSDTFTVNVGDIAQTSADSQGSNLGDFGGYAISKDHTKQVKWTANENGMFMAIAYVRPRKTAYVNHISRDLLKRNYFDYLLPQFGGVGYQNKYVGEVFNAPNASREDMYAVYGNEERYHEYMMLENECSGVMSTTHNFLHVDRDFSGGVPTVDHDDYLENRYITPKDNINRIFKDRITDPVLMTIWFDGTVTRQLPATIQTDF